MLLSVIMPTYNRAAYLWEASASLACQGLPPGQMELIVVDDGSDDGTPDLVKKIRSEYPDLQLKYFRQDHKGISAARNRGIRESRGEWIGFLDSDDLWAPDKAVKQLAYLENHPDARIVFTRYKNFRDASLELLSPRQDYLLQEVEDRYLATALVHRSLFEQNGLYCERLATGEDTEWVRRSSLLGTDIDHMIEAPLYLRRIHGDNISLNHLGTEGKRHREILLEALRMAAMVRKRQKTGGAGREASKETEALKEEI